MCVRVSVYVCKDSLFIAVVVKVTLFIYDLPKVAIKKQTKKKKQHKHFTTHTLRQSRTPVLIWRTCLFRWTGWGWLWGRSFIITQQENHLINTHVVDSLIRFRLCINLGFWVSPRGGEAGNVKTPQLPLMMDPFCCFGAPMKSLVIIVVFVSQ